MTKKRDREDWRTGLLIHRSYMRRLNKRPEYTLQGLARMIAERKKDAEQKKGEDQP